jgi:murein hydrolase activator
VRQLLLAALLLAVPAAIAAPPTPADLRAAEAAQRTHLAQEKQAASRAAVAAARARQLDAQRESAARALRAAEEQSQIAATRIAQLAAERRAAEADLRLHAQRLRPLLPAMERLSLAPAATLLAAPGSPEDAVRGAILLRGVAVTLESEAATLRRRQAELARLQKALTAAEPALHQAEARQAQEGQALDAAFAAASADKARASAEAEAEARAAAEAAGRARDIRAALAAIAAARAAEARRAAEEAARLARAHRTREAEAARARAAALRAPAGPGLKPGEGKPWLPVAGAVVRNWGDATPAGPAAGITIRAAPAARVVSPCAGAVDFAAPFRSYGELVILDCGGGWHFVLSGFARLEVREGVRVRDGQPLGVMAAWDPRSATPAPLLYVELRHPTDPVDPTPYLRRGLPTG